MTEKTLEITCAHATFLSSKKEEHKTSLLENTKLEIHYSICDACKLFADQSTFIANQAKYSAEFNQENFPPNKINELKEIFDTP